MSNPNPNAIITKGFEIQCYKYIIVAFDSNLELMVKRPVLTNRSASFNDELFYLVFCFTNFLITKQNIFYNSKKYAKLLKRPLSEGNVLTVKREFGIQRSKNRFMQGFLTLF